MFTEARLILPNLDNNGDSLDVTHDVLAEYLIDAFGGFTSQAVQGGFKGEDGTVYREAGTAYDVALDDSADNQAYLRGIARWAAGAADQECVYLRQPSGAVEFIEPETAPTVPAE